MKEMIKKVRERREGFTMAELLIVVAIVAVLVAIAIPVFSAQLHKSQDATDLANARSLYAELQADYLATTNKTAYTGASWDSTDLANAKTIAAGGSFTMSDGQTIKLNNCSITLALDTANDRGRSVTCECAKNDLGESGKFGYQAPSTGGSGGSTGGGA